jgi:hypothetical protein
MGMFYLLANCYIMVNLSYINGADLEIITKTLQLRKNWLAEFRITYASLKRIIIDRINEISVCRIIVGIVVILLFQLKKKREYIGQ